MKRKFSPIGFIKKFADETAALAFTLAGSTVVFVTLSGQTRKIAIIATGAALLVHYIRVMAKNDMDQYIAMYEYHVKKVTKVVDGDTIDVDIDLGFDISFSSRVRLAGIDTPESRTTDLAEKALGLEVKDKLKHLIEGAKSIVIKTEKMDSSEKYGRILGWLYLDGAETSVNEALVAGGYAWSYMGDTKVKDFEALRKKRAENK